MNSMQSKIQNLAESVSTHEALNNAFYRRWMSQPLSLTEVGIFARNYLARTTNTSRMIALSFLGANDLIAKVEIVKNLYSEFGYGHPEKAHIALLEAYLADLLSRLAGRPFNLDELKQNPDIYPLLPTTHAFIEKQHQLYTDNGVSKKDPRHILGTLLAQEWLAYSMLTRLYEGARNYQTLYPSNDIFHEHCEYFYIHIGDAEKEHKIQAVKAATQECRTEEDVQALTGSFNRFLDITAEYWRGIANAMAMPRVESLAS